ncbi:MAG: DUF885 domain-containing protein [Betaproteobacteria bacterium]|nr:DUF885 domain-containing protein [Betaproteobacteria bacterium]
MPRRLLVLAVLAIAPLGSAFAAEPPPDPALHALFDREFLRRQEESPEFATMLGNPAFNDRLHDGSREAIARRKAHVKTVLGELARFDPKQLSTQDRISVEVMKDNLRRTDALNALYGDLPFGASFGDGWMQLSPSSGPHSVYPMLVKATPFRSTRDYENYLKRLDAIARVLEQSQAVMEAGIKSGWMPPRAAMVRVPGQLAVFAGADVMATPLYVPFLKFPAAVAPDEQARLAQAARTVLARRVHPAFAALKQFVEEKYLPACRIDLAASTLPAGKRYYEMMIAANTTTDLDAKEIHETGKREVARIRAEMDKVIASTGFKGSFAQFVQSIRTDPRFYHKSAEEMLMHYRDIAKRADAELPRLFAELPRLPYGIRPMEAYEGDNAEHYTSGALDGSRAGFFEANTNNLSRRAKYDMEAVLLHETVPGHHLQTSRARELKGLPSFRRAAHYVAYGEGWALYAESLGEEMGMYRDPYSKFGRLSAEMWRACRLVVDTGLHAFGWTRDQSIRYLADNSGIQESAAIAETDRYILTPGQALGYKIGELRIKALRARAQQALGEGFDLRRFHNALLDDGALPLTVLDSRIDEWIAREKLAR